MKYMTLTSSLILTGLLISNSLYAEEQDEPQRLQGLEPKVGAPAPPPFPIVPITDGYEAYSIEFDRALGGRIYGVELRTCPSCEKKRFKLSSGTELLIKNQPSTLEDIGAMNGEAGTVIYDLKTSEVTLLHFYPQEDE